jgi:hypothetical protein
MTGRRGRRIGAIAFVIAGVCAIAIPAFAASRNNETTTSKINGTIKRIVVSTQNGTVSIRPGTPQVKRVEHWNHTRPRYTQRLEDGTLTVEAECPTRFLTLPFNNCAVDLALLVPRDVTVKAATANGPITVSDLTGSTIDVSSTNGTLTLANLASRSVEANTSNGNIELTSTSRPASIETSSTNGNIDVAIPKGAYDIRTSTTNGDVSVKGLEDDPDANDELSASTTNGDIALRAH